MENEMCKIAKDIDNKNMIADNNYVNIEPKSNKLLKLLNWCK